MFRIPSEDQRALIAQLNTNPAWHALKVWSQQQRDGYMTNLAQTIWKNPDVLNEAAVREKAAFFRGMNTLLNQPFFSAQMLKRAVEQPTEEQQ